MLVAERDRSDRRVTEKCQNEVVRADLESALDEGGITEDGLHTLRSEYSLTWRELQIFVRYYLPGDDMSSEACVSNRRRLDLANRLGITEYTVRHHINVLRSKIGLTRQRGMAMYHWAIANGIVRPHGG